MCAGSPLHTCKVMSLRATPSGVGDFWATSPQDRLDAHPSLPEIGEVIAMTGTPTGPAVLFKAPLVPPSSAGAKPAPQGLRLLVLCEQRWREVVLPPEALVWAAEHVRGADDPPPAPPASPTSRGARARAGCRLVSTPGRLDPVC